MMAAAVFACAAPAFAETEVSVLLDKLVEKGVLTPVEAQIIEADSQKKVSQDMAKGTASGVPEWVQKIKMKGDLRMRYQHEEIGESTLQRDRFRARLRLGVQAKVTDGVEVNAGIATGNDGDARSTNQTFDSTASKRALWLDYAYGKIRLINGLNAYAGKITRNEVLWCPTDLLWDGDINPEGAAVTYKLPVGSAVEAFTNVGGYALSERNSTTDTQTDPYMFVVQPGAKLTLGKTETTAAVAVYKHAGTRKRSLSNGKDTSGSYNTLVGGAGTGLKYDYNVINPSVEFGVSNPFGDEFTMIPYVGAMGDYVVNPDPNDKNKGYEKQWQLGYIYKRLEKDAWLDVFPDSDSYNGNTGVKGHKLSAGIGLAKNLTLNLAYFNMGLIDKVTSNGQQTDKRQDLFQFDINWKF
jgi:hypothetical protein